MRVTNGWIQHATGTSLKKPFTRIQRKFKNATYLIILILFFVAAQSFAARVLWKHKENHKYQKLNWKERKLAVIIYSINSLYKLRETLVSGSLWILLLRSTSNKGGNKGKIAIAVLKWSSTRDTKYCHASPQVYAETTS